ncbi:hypothetical protein WMF18_26540 [Sorangium sp. So ce315]|uniref:hypothetical protein n=1 Tax=Sorangium sp. So ce315 TaxID=3133299 RepID=UPI003F5FEE75
MTISFWWSRVDGAPAPQSALPSGRMSYAADVRTAPPSAPSSPRKLLLAAASLAACACQPRPAPPAPYPEAAPAPSSAVVAAPAAPDAAGPAPQPAPAPRGDSAARPPQAAAGDGAAGIALDGMSPVKLAPPPFGQSLVRPAPAGSSAAPRLVKVAEQKNEITDEAAWFTRNGLSLPLLEVPSASPPSGAGALPPFVPTRYRDQVLVRAIDHGDHLALLYGPSFSDARFVAIVDAGRKVVAVLDFESFLTPREIAPGEASFVEGRVVWAVARDGVLYVSSGHMTYAASSKGKNAFLSAIDLASGQLLWQSAPLVCNAENFVLRGDHLLCGYGFTAEPDFLYVLERATGKIVSKLPIKSKPDFFVEKEGKLFVRTYDTDYIFEIR